MTICYVKYINLRAEDDCNKLVFFSGFMDAFEYRNEVLALKDKNGDDILFDGEVGMFEYFSRKELIEELNKISSSARTFSGHIK